VFAEGRHWYAIRTRSRHEKLVHRQLTGRGVEPFLPLVTRISRWKDRRKKIQIPLFSGYCFARFALSEKLLVLKAVGVVDVVGISGYAEPLPAEEIEAIQRLVASPLRYDPYPYLKEGMWVEVIRGPLMGVKGILVRKEPRDRLVLTVNLIRQAASVEIDTADIAPL
jgi:transcription antitermination factor NusG